MNTPRIRILSLGVLVSALSFGCSSAPVPVKTQAYAELQKERTLEHEFPAVWKGLEAALKDQKIVKRDPESVTTTAEWNELESRTLETDWVYSQSRDKYIEFKVNNFPRKQYLQIRFRYRVEAKKVLGGTHLIVNLDEQIERLDAAGKSKDYEDVEKPDSTRANGLIDATERQVLGAAP